MPTEMSKKIERLLKDIRDTLKGVDRKLDKLDRLRNPEGPRETDQDLVLFRHQLIRDYAPRNLRSLPNHLKQSMETITTYGQATATQISNKTGRSRAAESDYLNQLASRGFLKKRRQGKEILFMVHNLRTICPNCGSPVIISANYCSRCGSELSEMNRKLATPSIKL